MKKKLVVVISLVLLVCILALSFTACNKTKTSEYYAYGTFLEITSKGDSDAAYNYIDSLEAILSPTVEGSDIYKINHSNIGEAIKCSDITMYIMQVAELVYAESNGAYDPSVYPLVRAWNFSSDRYGLYTNIPSELELADALFKVGLSTSFSIDYNAKTITKLIDGAMLDFGGVAKGFAVDNALALVDGEALINLGGNVAGKGKEYTIGIANPDREDRQRFTGNYMEKVSLPDNYCVATSGDYQRYYKVGDKYYHHIINPKTGQCADTTGEDGVVSCSIIADNGALGDAVATAVIVLGKTEGIKLIEKLKLSAVIIDSEFNVTKI